MRLHRKALAFIRAQVEEFVESFLALYGDGTADPAGIMAAATVAPARLDPFPNRVRTRHPGTKTPHSMPGGCTALEARQSHRLARKRQRQARRAAR